MIVSRRLSHLAAVFVSNVDKLTNEGEIPVRLCNYVDVYKNETVHPGLDLMEATATPSEIARFRLVPGDTVFTKDSETADDIGVPAFVTETADDFVCGYHLAIARPRRGLVDPKYLYWWLRSSKVARQWEVRASGVTRVGLRQTDIGKLPLEVVDDVDIQRSIAEFLDRETAQIDAMIDAQLRLLIRLAERRTAILDGLVQRVVDTHSTIRLKFVAQVTVGIVVTPSLWYADEGVPALRGVNVRPEQIDLAELVRLNEEGDRLHAKSRLRAGDVVVVRTGQAGSAAVITPELDGVNAIDLLIIRPGQELDGGYLAAVINSNFVRGQIASASVGAIQSHFNVEALANLHVPVMPPEEQLAFLNEWRASRGRVDGMIARTEELIGLMRERRAALITAAVTGRLDPRTGVEQLDEVLKGVAS